MARHGNRIHKRADGRWEGRYKSGINANGTTKYSSVYAHSYAECAENLQMLSITMKSQTAPSL